MRTKIFLAGIALFSLPLSLPAQAQDKGKSGQGSEKSKSAERNGGADQAVSRANKGAGKAKERSPNVKGQNARSAGKIDANNGRKFSSPANKQVRADRKSDQRGNNDRATIIPRDQDVRGENFRRRTVENGRYVWREPSFQGCPPGLAKKNNGCLPPGQARKLGGIDDRGTRWHRYSNWFSENRGGDWRYDRGYAYRIDPATGLVRGIVPLLGGALFGGNTWPQSYTDYKVSPYHERYFGSGVTNGVRYANGALFTVNPETQMIGSIAGLLTGDSWNVGSPAPQGYELYNVPYNYRDRYADTGSSSYRYNDGYVYQIDPKTQLVRQIIELIV
jgi:hypothetical protein